MAHPMQLRHRWREAVTADRGIRPASWRVGAVLSEHMDARGMCWPSLRRIEEQTGYDHATVLRALRQLEHRGWLARERRGGRGRSTRYTALFSDLETPAVWGAPGTPETGAVRGAPGTPETGAVRHPEPVPFGDSGGVARKQVPSENGRGPSERPPAAPPGEPNPNPVGDGDPSPAPAGGDPSAPAKLRAIRESLKPDPRATARALAAQSAQERSEASG